MLSKGIFPAVDALASSSTILDPVIVGQERHRVAQEVIGTLQRCKDLQDIIAILGIDELSVGGGQAAGQPRPPDRAVPVAEHDGCRAVHRVPGSTVPLKETIDASDRLTEGESIIYRSRPSS